MVRDKRKLTARRAVEALRNGVPNRAAVETLGCRQPKAEAAFAGAAGQGRGHARRRGPRAGNARVRRLRRGQVAPAGPPGATGAGARLRVQHGGRQQGDAALRPRQGVQLRRRQCPDAGSGRTPVRRAGRRRRPGLGALRRVRRVGRGRGVERGPARDLPGQPGGLRGRQRPGAQRPDRVVLGRGTGYGCPTSSGGSGSSGSGAPSGRRGSPSWPRSVCVSRSS